MFEKMIRANRLLEVYAGLLTERHARITRFYYLDNLSLSEIAEIEGISRQAVHDGIERSLEMMESADVAMGLVGKADRMMEITDRIAELAQDETSEEQYIIRKKIKELAERLSEELQFGGK